MSLLFSERKYSACIVSRSPRSIFLLLNNTIPYVLFSSESGHPNPFTAILPENIDGFFYETDSFFIRNGIFFNSHYSADFVNSVVQLRKTECDIMMSNHIHQTIIFCKNWLENKPGINCLLKSPEGEQLQRSMKNLYLSLHSGEYGRFFGLLADFLGAGPGLTPSSDDFACGCIHAFQVFQKISNIPFRISVNTFLRSARLRTNRLSVRYIACALLKIRSEWQYELAQKILSGVVDEMFLNSCVFGHTSSYDYIYGFCFAGQILSGLPV